MSSSTLAILVISILVSSGLWVSMRAIDLADLQAAVERLPARQRRRVLWWQGNAKHIQLLCALVAAATVCVQLSSNVG